MTFGKMEAITKLVRFASFALNAATVKNTAAGKIRGVGEWENGKVRGAGRP